MNRDFDEAGSFGIITDVGKLGELHSCAGLQMHIDRAVLTSHWLGMADAIGHSRLTIATLDRCNLGRPLGGEQ